MDRISTCRKIAEGFGSPKCFYISLLIVTSFLMASTLLPTTQTYLRSVFRDFNATCIDNGVRGENGCMELIGYGALYKVSCPVVTFFFLLSCLSLRFTWIHRGFWFCKIGILLSSILFSFLIPISHFEETRTFWIYLTLSGNILFVFLVLYALVDSSKSLGEIQATNLTEIILSMIIVISWMISVFGILVYHGSVCFAKGLILSLSSCMAACIILTAFFSRILKTDHEGRVFQAGIVALFISYLTWSALLRAPFEEPEWLKGAGVCGEAGINEKIMLSSTDFILMIGTISYLFRGSLCKNERDIPRGLTENEDPEIVILSSDNVVIRRKRESRRSNAFSIPTFYALCSLALMFMTTQLAGIYGSESDVPFERRDWSSVGMKAGLTWVVCLIYFVYLILPKKILSLGKRPSASSSALLLNSPIFSRRNRRNDVVAHETSHI